MVWRKLPILEWSSEMAQSATSAALYSTSCFLRLAIGQLIIAMKTAYESIGIFLLPYGIFQLFAISVLLPAYFARVLTGLIPTILGTIWCLIFPWDKLIEQTESSRRQSAMFAQLQLEGKYIFRVGDVARVNRSGTEWMSDILWEEHTEEFEVMPRLRKEGHEIYALDWIGHGRSDKPIHRESVTFELHMQTVMAFVNHVQLQGAVLVGHSWGGYVALCCIPHLPSSSCSGLFLMNSFMPCQPKGMGIDGRIIYGFRFLLSRVLDGYISQSTLTRLLLYDVPRRDAKGYGAPYRDIPANARPSFEPFDHISIGVSPHILRYMREKPLWKACEAICPKGFAGLNSLALLSERVDSASRYVLENRSGDKKEGTEGRIRSAIVFGEHDPLGRGYKKALACEIGKGNMVNCALNGIMIENAGHYPMEDKPEDVAQLIARFV
ncbi:uncharacterized protein N7496_009113 [Penicillium cataractarum]|uniref:AB hydrolase-1 domain-containing protein n=1 Tax=Penicillium cataractarum TaxID=2100454 RepID=A0A9W9V568_9EURO|nr:uncharacterized protein N7496_009113 [Penicillium cataractarum]KAJ5369353.1 hypothetical protein N7496_009113 [Penicillium cataractarum]